MEHVNGWYFRGIYKSGLWENDLHVSARIRILIGTTVVRTRILIDDGRAYSLSLRVVLLKKEGTTNNNNNRAKISVDRYTYALKRKWR